ncbi:transporter substrate-binding domain-containing protein [Renibacterium salmoninarum]|uniref:transporter substrate-binding domain-containing protein n=1 Tax=Renibacterium salmoninarum TaxID=1646 RepID=UPI002D792B5C|nr:transporter substrate-binding domain-containing protein [Renibacterium salmoninarum]
MSFHATDDNTVIGSEIDLAQLVADKLGLSLDLQVTSWESWPLKTQSGAYNLVFSNVGINDERKKLFLISRAIAPHIWASSQPARHRPSSIQQMM